MPTAGLPTSCESVTKHVVSGPGPVCGPARARDAAEVAYAMLVGLRTASYFDEQLSPAHARQLFYAEMQNLANAGRTGRAARPRTR